LSASLAEKDGVEWEMMKPCRVRLGPLATSQWRG